VDRSYDHPTMALQTATAPGSWGVERPASPANPPWQRVLDEVAAAGFDGVELGPVGFLPEQPARLRAELGERGLALAGGFVMEPFHRRVARLDVLAVARRTCRILAAGGATNVVLIESLQPARAATAGRSAAAERLDRRGWATLVDTVSEVARMASGDFGLEAAFHPHAGTVVEFPDEIDRLLASTDAGLVGLCVDSGHSLYAGVDAVGLVRAAGGRLRHVHLKDVRADLLGRARLRRLTFERAVAAGVFCPLGEGAVDLEGLRDALARAGYEGWLTFEQDRCAGDRRARADAAASLAYLRRIGLAGMRETAR
jgi:inosose dehydratase